MFHICSHYYLENPLPVPFQPLQLGLLLVLGVATASYVEFFLISSRFSTFVFCVVLFLCNFSTKIKNYSYMTKEKLQKTDSRWPSA